MVVLESFKTDKIKHRKQIDIDIIIHDNTIEKIQSVFETESQTVLKLFNNLVDYKITDDAKIISNKAYTRTRDFWKTVYDNLPKVKLDGRLQVGDYTLFNNIYIRVRSSERFKKQIIEIVYEVKNI